MLKNFEQVRNQTAKLHWYRERRWTLSNIHHHRNFFYCTCRGEGQKKWQISWSTFSPFHVILSTFRVCLSKKPKKSPPRVPRLCFSPKILFFLWIKTPSKFSESRDDRFREKSKYLSMVHKVSWDRNLKTAFSEGNFTLRQVMDYRREIK